MKHQFNLAFSITTVLLAFVFIACAADKDAAQQTETVIPDFRANDQNGDLWQLKDHLDQDYLVVYFYPVAMTGGCTKQACAYRDFKSDLAEKGVTVVGVSGDAVRNLKYFEQANNLNFTLLSDVNGQIAGLFAVPIGDGGTISRDIDGQSVSLTRGVTTKRWTFILDKNAKVIYQDTDVDAANDSKAVMEFLDKGKR